MECKHCQTPLPDGSVFCPQCGVDQSDPGSQPRKPGTGTDLLGWLTQVVEGRYKVHELIGQGGMGAVFRAEDLTLGRLVAIKVLPPELSSDESFAARFEREARTAAKLDHPNIIPIYAVESKEGLHFFVMKLIEGRGLDEILRTGPIPVDTVQRIIWEAACALGHAHQRGIVHRDIKPANVMIDQAGHAIIADFGISKSVHSAATQLTATGQIIGTPHYISPEQGKGTELDGRSDQYSLGVVAYRMLADKLPFEDAAVHSLVYKHIFEEPPPLKNLRPDAPDFLVAAVTKAMAKTPQRRFATMEEFATAVWPEHPVSAGLVTPVTPLPGDADSAATVVTGGVRKKRGLAVALMSGLVLIIGGAGGALYISSKDGVGRAGTTSTGALPIDSQPVTAVLPLPSSSDSQPAGEAQDEVPAATDLVAPVTTPTRFAAPPRQQPRPQQRAAPTTGFITISATPFGTASVDGIEIGDTPVVRYEVSPGRHIVRIEREGFQTAVDTVNVRTRNETRLRKTLIREQATP
ncbi:MAG: protein kinase [Gemmatimonadetes bacterium]|nr:protein kinase [Gemmatimonadota bacterium]